MRHTLILTGLIACSVSLGAAAEPPRTTRPSTVHVPHAPAPAPPRAIGRFEEWTAATHQEAGQTVCYAFTRATTSVPALPGRGDVVLTVTQRPGAARDAVAISAGFAYGANAEVQVQVDQASLPFYTTQRSAFARDGHVAVIAFERSRQAVARSPAPHGAAVTDTFNLHGFSPAYAAINKACSVKS